MEASQDRGLRATHFLFPALFLGSSEERRVVEAVPMLGCACSFHELWARLHGNRVLAQ